MKEEKEAAEETKAGKAKPAAAHTHAHEHAHEHAHAHGEATEESEEAIPAHALPPPVDFGLHLQSLQMQAWIHLGKIPDPTSGQTSRNLPWARFFIDMLGMLEEKTKGNLTTDEKRYMDMTLTTLRLTFVEEQKTPD